LQTRPISKEHRFNLSSCPILSIVSEPVALLLGIAVDCVVLRGGFTVPLDFHVHVVSTGIEFFELGISLSQSIRRFLFLSLDFLAVTLGKDISDLFIHYFNEFRVNLSCVIVQSEGRIAISCFSPAVFLRNGKGGKMLCGGFLKILEFNNVEAFFVFRDFLIGEVVFVINFTNI
jgi:hypothetical protein